MQKIFHSIARTSLTGRGWGWVCFSLFTLMSCSPEPPLHLYDAQEIEMEMPVIDLNLDVFWDYEFDLGIDYNWRTEWYYGWDDTDRELFGELGYTEPTVFNLRRYYTASTPLAPHTAVIANSLEGNHSRERYNWGYWVPG